MTSTSTTSGLGYKQSPPCASDPTVSFFSAAVPSPASPPRLPRKANAVDCSRNRGLQCQSRPRTSTSPCMCSASSHCTGTPRTTPDFPAHAPFPQHVTRGARLLSDVLSALLEGTTLFIGPYICTEFHRQSSPSACVPPPFAATHPGISAHKCSRGCSLSTRRLPLPLPAHNEDLLVLIDPGKSQGTREGAIWGLIGVGKEAVIKGLVGCTHGHSKSCTHNGTQTII